MFDLSIINKLFVNQCLQFPGPTQHCLNIKKVVHVLSENHAFFCDCCPMNISRFNRFIPCKLKHY